MNDFTEFDRLKKLADSKIMKALMYQGMPIVNEASSLEQAKICQQVADCKITISAQQLLDEINKVSISSAVLDRLKKITQDAANRKRWATDPMELMPYFNRFKFSKLRQSLSFFLYDLARWVDPDFLD
jgi:hypothetical protein